VLLPYLNPAIFTGGGGTLKDDVCGNKPRTENLQKGGIRSTVFTVSPAEFRCAKKQRLLYAILVSAN